MAGALDEAANEDARVQLRKLKTQQAVVGLNTRWQRLYLDHRADATRNERLSENVSRRRRPRACTRFVRRARDQGRCLPGPAGGFSDSLSSLEQAAAHIVELRLGVEKIARIHRPLAVLLVLSVATIAVVVTRRRVEGGA